jgi:HEAT repeat protein
VISLASKALLATLLLLVAGPAVAQKKKLSLAELAALEWKLEQAGNTLTGNPDVAARAKAVADLASLKDSRTAKPLATALREDPDAGVRQKAAEALAALKTPEGKGLLTLASTADPDAGVRGSAASLLKGFPKKMAVATLPMASRPFQAPKAAPTLPVLQKTLSLPSGDARLWAMQKLGALKGAGTTQLLEKHLLKDPSARVRTEAGKSLAAQLKIKSLPTLIKAAEDGDPSVRFEIAHLISAFDDPGALMVLQKLASADVNETVKAEAQDLLEPSTPVGRRLLKTRIAKLRSANPAERIAAMGELSSSTHWRAMLPMSCALLNDKSVNVRTAAARVLTNMHDSTVLTAMRVAAELESDKKLQGTVRGMLTGMRKRVDALVKQLQSGEAAARVLAARALGQAAYPQGLDPLIAALKDKDAKVRLSAARALVNYTDPKAKEALKLAGTDSDKRVRGAVDRFFKEQQQLAGWRTFYKDPNRVVTKTTDKDAIWRFDAAIALGVAGAESAVASLAQLLLHDKEESVRHAAAWALVLMGSDRGEAALKTAAAKDPSEKLRLTARKYLVIDKVSVDDLVRQLRDDAAASRQDAAEALSLRASGKVLNYLIRSALCDNDSRVRSASLRGLARIGNKMARAVILVSLSRDDEARVRRTAMVMHILAGGK